MQYQVQQMLTYKSYLVLSISTWSAITAYMNFNKINILNILPISLKENQLSLILSWNYGRVFKIKLQNSVGTFRCLDQKGFALTWNLTRKTQFITIQTSLEYHQIHNLFDIKVITSLASQSSFNEGYILKKKYFIETNLKKSAN
jgi:hypothetical protein